MSFTIEQVTAALAQVTHPAFGNDIISLNMVSDIRIDGNNVSFTLTFQKANDPLIGSIQKACRVSLQTNLGPEVQMGELKIESHQKMAEPKAGALSKVKNIIAVASGKGGVGKSTVASNLAVALAKIGYKVGLIDADVYGPSMPKMFDVEDVKPELKQDGNLDLIVPVEKYGVKMLSVGFFVNPNDALVWRGPMATSALKQLIHQGDWGELDFLMLDLPPGTGDVHLTMVQEMAITGTVIVSTPQQVALADAIKGINMFRSDKINVPVLGLIENMAWFTPEELPNNKYFIFGKEGCKQLAESMSVPLLGQIPIVQGICEGGDAGKPIALDENSITGKAFIAVAKQMIEEVNQRNVKLDPTKRVEISHK
ncbi:MAG TPA: Mrp/NBP35 family ATP-binding protein [Bacteroidales bacterium]|nr:Mrp/NBP35 family ATP-binding protein [Bacteroidales bacterium]